jgi:hypothetical protein
MSVYPTAAPTAPDRLRGQTFAAAAQTFKLLNHQAWGRTGLKWSYLLTVASERIAEPKQLSSGAVMDGSF